MSDFIHEFGFALMTGIGLYLWGIFRDGDSIYIDPALPYVFGLTVLLGLTLVFFAVRLDLPLGEVFMSSQPGRGGKLVFMFWAFLSGTCCSALVSSIARRNL